jgi:hypothetical protein
MNTEFVAVFRRLRDGTFVVALCGACMGTIAATAPAEPAAEPIEEIEVIGQRALISLRFEMRAAEDHMYELFNALNSSDKFDTTCADEIRILSHIRQRVCNKRYMQDARRENVQAFMENNTPLKSEVQIWTENTANHEDFRAEMKALAEQNRDFALAIVDVVEKRKRYEETRRERFGDGWLARLGGAGD